MYLNDFGDLQIVARLFELEGAKLGHQFRVRVLIPDKSRSRLLRKSKLESLENKIIENDS